MADDNKKRNDRSETWQEARALLLAHRRQLALGAFLMLINRLAGLALPASSKYIIDEVVIKGRNELLLPFVIVAGAATLLQSITSFSVSQILGLAAQRAITEMRKRVQAHVGRLPIRYFDSSQIGRLISRIMTDTESVRNLVGTGLVQLSGSLLTAVIATGVLFYLNWRLTALTITIFLTFGGIMSYASKKLRPILRERGEIYSQVTGRLAESLGGIRIIKAYTAEPREEQVFAQGMHRLFRSLKRSTTGTSAMTACSPIVVGTAGIVIIVVGVNSILSGGMTLGDLFMYIFFTGLMALPVLEAANLGMQITEAFAGLDRIRETMSIPIEDEGDSSKETISEIRGAVEFENVWFEYHPQTPVLKNITFKAAPGSTTALIGPSGSGKSTLIGLIMSFNRPLSGKVKIDGRDLSMIKLRDYRSHLGVVLQDNFLFDGTIAENISFSRPQAAHQEIQTVSRLAHCEEFIEGFDQKYQTVVGERGVKLSGGQRQRIGIARALLADPKILILDEATSSLDTESELSVQAGLRSLCEGRTTFIIAHRLSTIRGADQILILEEGRIIEQGTHESLLAAGGRYKKLYELQFRFEDSQFSAPGEAAESRALAAEKKYTVRP